MNVAHNFTIVSKMKDFLMSQAITDSVKVIICRRRCKIEALLLQSLIWR